MNPLAVALAWAGSGAVSAVLFPRWRRRRLGVITPLAGLIAVLVTGAGAATGFGHLDRVAAGLLALSAASMTVAFLLAPTIRGVEALTIGLTGGAVVVALSSNSLALRSLALLTAVGAIALRWVTAAPGRGTLAAGRVPGGGTAALLAAAVFLPLPASATGPRPAVVGILLASGMAALIALLPLGGWAAAGFAALRGIDIAPWQLSLAPAALLIAAATPQSLPDLAATMYGQLLLAAGLLTAVWSGLMAVRTAPTTRYGRVFIADLGLAAAAIGSGSTTLALAGALLVVITHLTLAPLLLTAAEGRVRPAHHAAWALLSGVPPSPSFWARFLLVEALVQADPATLFAAVPALAALFIAAVLAALPTRAGDPGASAGHSVARDLAGWVIVATALAVGLVPEAAASFVFGS
ncbi:MAG: hypothetical protein E6J45_02785 [Chloroflexi bacterium]|nr:MAG: hypothetical protein E6J45_02785 [Chloroflexota bacterium]